jgi:hypothetical protein
LGGEEWVYRSVRTTNETSTLFLDAWYEAYRHVGPPGSVITCVAPALQAHVCRVEEGVRVGQVHRNGNLPAIVDLLLDLTHSVFTLLQRVPADKGRTWAKRSERNLHQFQPPRADYEGKGRTGANGCTVIKLSSASCCMVVLIGFL